MCGSLLTFATILEKHNLQTPLFYGISDRGAFPDLDPLDYLELLFQTRAHVLQWREKDLDMKTNRRLIRRGVELARRTGKLFLVNSFVELALREAADGSHLTSTQCLGEALDARKRFATEEFILGKSAHSGREAAAAEREGADYVLLGPIFEPISKEASIQPLGLAALRETAQMLYIPVFALGGVDERTFPEIAKTSAWGGAGISWLRQEVVPLLKESQRCKKELPLQEQ